MFAENIRSYLKGSLSKKNAEGLKNYLSKIAAERFRASSLDVDIDSEVEDAAQGFLAYLQGTWYPNHRASVANMENEELGGRVVLVYHRWLTGRIETKRAEPPPGPMPEEDQEAATVWRENQATPEAIAARKVFEQALGPAAVEWARRERGTDFRFIYRLIERGLKEGETADEIFNRIVRTMEGKTLKFPKPTDLLYARFRGLLERLYPKYFTQQELAYIVGVPEANIYHQVLKEREWEKPGELEEEIKFRRVAALSGNEGSDEVRLLARLDDVIRAKSGMAQIDLEERAERLADALENMREERSDPKSDLVC